MKKKTALLDVDGVITDFVGQLEHFGLVNANNVTNWNVERAVDPALRRTLKALLKTDDFWYDMPFIPGALEGLRAFEQSNYKIVLLTAPYEDYKGFTCARQKLQQSLKNEHAIVADLVITEDKHHVNGDIFIDDKPLNVELWQRMNKKTAYLFDQPYNQDADLNRVLGWQGIIKWLSINI